MLDTAECGRGGASQRVWSVTGKLPEYMIILRNCCFKTSLWLRYCGYFFFLRKNSYLEIRGFAGGSDSKESACNAEDPGLLPGLEMATHLSIRAWRFPRTEEPGRLQPRGGRVGHSWATNIYLWCCFSVTNRVQLFATPWTAACRASLSLIFRYA